MLKILKTYWKVRKVFVFPKVNIRFCKWIKSGTLPVWRRGNRIILAKHYYEYDSKFDYARLIDSWWTDKGKDNHPILSKLFKHPIIQFPYWCSFYIFHYDVIWKQKYDELRFEYNPLLSIVIFGWSLNIWLSCPIKGNIFNDDHYWECIINYIYGVGHTKNICNFAKDMGVWSKTENNNRIDYYALQPEYLKEPYKTEYLNKIKEYIWKKK